MEPEFLKKGDTIGIICPAGSMPMDKMKKCIAALEQWGYKVKTGVTAGSSYHYFSATDEDRLADLQAMLDDDSVNAILCARGGYGISRIIDMVDFKKFKKKPKWIIGYSDVSVLHAHIFSKYKTVSLHSPMAGAFNDAKEKDPFILSLKKILEGKKASYTFPAHALNRRGTASGVLVGGNLSLVVNLIGTASEVNTKGKILFLEDVGEYLYHIDRMFTQLKRCGKLDNLAGLVIGSFTEMKDTVVPFGQQVYELIKDKIKEYDYPVCFGFPVGHTAENVALKHGAMHELKINASTVSLKEKTASKK